MVVEYSNMILYNLVIEFLPFMIIMYTVKMILLYRVNANYRTKNCGLKPDTGEEIK